MAMRFVCDEMLKGLARWLRAAGHDTVVPEPGSDDAALLCRARTEERLLLTRDHGLSMHRGAEERVVLLECDGVESCIAALNDALAVDWEFAPFSRCLRCNTPLVAAPAESCGRVPANVRAEGGELRYCPVCDQPFWNGGHVARMRARLRRWNEGRGRGGAIRKDRY